MVVGTLCGSHYIVSRVLAFALPLDDDGVSLLDRAIHQGDIPVPWQIAPIEG